MLTTEPLRKTWLPSLDFRVLDDSEEVAQLRSVWSANAATFQIDGIDWQASRAGDSLTVLGGRRQTLVTAGKTVCRAEQPSLFSRRFECEMVGSEPTITLTAVSVWSREFRAEQSGEVIGEVRPVSVFRSEAIAELPDRLPLPVRVFLLYLVFNSWRHGDADG